MCVVGLAGKHVRCFLAKAWTKAFEDLSGQQSRVPLDDEHKKLIQYLADNKMQGWFDQDHWCMVCHTADLKQAHTELNFKGIFETSTSRSSPQNCFAFPLRNGAWALRRYSQGVKEHSSWDQDGAGWTRCYFNREPSLKVSARTYEGVEHAKGGYMFKHAEMAKQAVEQLGARIDLPAWIASRPARIREHKDGRIIMEMDHSAVDDSKGMESWVLEKGKYTKIFDIKAHDATELDVSAFDDLVRHIVDAMGNDAGWMIKSQNKWKSEPLTHVKAALAAMGFSPPDITNIVGTNVMKCWTLVNLPFQDEYPADRQWNRDAAQYRFRPSLDTDSLSYPTWMLILDHIGQSLNGPIKDHPWCKQNCIMTGAEYLKCWVASVFQHPLEPLPYLFLFGEQDTGKSILHEALSLLVTKGVVRADLALTSPYNGELANAILAIIEEVDLQKNKQAYNRMKDRVTARQISIRALYEQAYMIPNSTHWIQCANDFKSCPILPGDARIVYINVPKIKNQIPKRQLITRLEKEAPDFLAAILSLEIPTSPDRLMIPVIATEEKDIAEDANQTFLEHYIKEFCHHVTGKTILYGEFYAKFNAWVPVSDRHEWSKIRTGRELPPKFPKGRLLNDGGQYHIGNLSWNPRGPNEPILPRLKRTHNDTLVPEATDDVNGILHPAADTVAGVLSKSSNTD